ncbi:MAG: DNA polymerase [Actinomycetaceae bacterium]|nr:DNA polymerase [Actinomycetaceae bacterium]
MKTLSCDLETYSPVNLAKAGVYRYAEHEDFDIVLFGYSFNHGPVHVIDLASGQKLPEEVLDALVDPGVVKWAHNAAFERVCISAWLRKHHPDLMDGREYLDPAQWRCTMIWSAYLGLPMSLEAAAGALDLEVQKDNSGKRLIKQFCTPATPSVLNGGGTRNLPGSDPTGWAQFIDYNQRDVEVELAIHDRLSLFPMPETEWDAYALDQRINDTGILLDRTLAHAAVALDDQHRSATLARARELTGLDNPNSPIQLKEWLTTHGCEMSSLAKADVEAALDIATGVVREVLELRGDLAKSSVKKYQAMHNVTGSDGRARGLLQFYGAGRTGRFAGRLVQVQNLPRNYLPDLKQARTLVKQGNLEALELLYDSIPDTLSQLIRTAFIPSAGCRFIVADYSAIEARVIAWLAGEQTTLAAFRDGKDLYCETASRMFGVPVEKHGENAQLRQKGKIAVLACIAEGQLVLTDHGEVPIEHITTDHKVWDGLSWVSHDGVIYKGEKHVITYDGLTATTDHLVWVQGKPGPIPLGQAAASGARLLQTGHGRHPIRVGQDHQPTKTLGQELEPLLRRDSVRGLRQNRVDQPCSTGQWEIERMPELLGERQSAYSALARPASDSSQTALHESFRSAVAFLRRAWHRVPILYSARGRAMDPRKRRQRASRLGIGSDRHQRPLREGQPQVRLTGSQHSQPPQHGALLLRATLLALRQKCSDQETLGRHELSRHHQRRPQSRGRQTRSLAANSGTTRVYDLLNAGPHHRYTVSGHLVHNCGYGGSVGALKAMGALRMGLAETELKPIVEAWRTANPNIVQLWADVDEAAITTVSTRQGIELGQLKFSYESGILFITLPSGRRLAYVQPRLGENRFGGTSITYQGLTTGRKWGQLETYGGKLVENIVQAIARDLLVHAMHQVTQAGYRIVMHVHDEIIIDHPTDAGSVKEVCQLMSQTPPWAVGLPLSADGYECEFYRKD